MDTEKSCCMCPCIKKFFSRHEVIKTICLTLMLIFGFLIFFLFLYGLESKVRAHISPDFFRNSRIIITPFKDYSQHIFNFFDNSESHPLLDFHNAYLIVLTALIAIIAWTQLKGLYTNSKADMLLRIDQLLRSEQALKALIILRQFRLEAEKKIRTPESSKKESYEEFKQKHQHGIAEAVGHKIKILLENNQHIEDNQQEKSVSEQKRDIEDSVHLINFLNTIEDVCYLCRKHYISSEDIEELFEHELSYYFKIFKPYIENLRKYGDSTMYNELQNLSEKIKCKDVCK